MNISKSFKDYLGLFLAGVFLVSSSYVGKRFEKPSIFISKQEKSLNLNNNFLARFNLGLKSLISSSLWIATIIESDYDHYKKKDLNSWMFLRFNSISSLDPKFYENYAFGGPYLSIIKDDLEGASIIYDKGLKQYPDDFHLLRDSGFHYYFEVGDFKKALLSYSKLKNHPLSTPLMITTLAKLESGEGNLNNAFTMLEDQYQKIENKESMMALKIASYLYAIKAEIDLECLNSSKSKDGVCSRIDFNGRPYVLKDQVYGSLEKWSPFRNKKR